MNKRVLLALISMAGLAAVTSANATVFEVQVVDFQFVPPTLTVVVGDSIHWTNDGEFPHTVTSGENCISDGDFDSGTLNPGQGWGYEVDSEDAGQTKHYFCTFHCGMGMTGSFTVEADTPTQESSWGKIKTLYR